LVDNENDGNEQIKQVSRLNNDEQQNTQNSVTKNAKLHSAAVLSEFDINEQSQYNSTTIHAELHSAAVSEFDINE
ncbi:38496_t:CDS:2, partial [Gigaspora margarita]